MSSIMVFVLGFLVMFFVSVTVIPLAVGAILGYNRNKAIVLGGLAVLAVGSGLWFQSHRIVPTQMVGVSRDAFSQELNGLYPSGLMSKPLFGSVYYYPASSNYQRCEQYTPAIKGSYGIIVDLCFYLDAGHVDWLAEVGRTGELSADGIMQVWRNSVVSAVARAVKDSTPEELSDNRAEVEQALFDNVKPWFDARGIPLTGISFKNWEFGSEEVASAFDASIVSQRRITEQAALRDAAKISREREMYEAETSRLVAEKQKESLDALGFTGDAAVQYLWIKTLSDGGKVPDILVLGASSIPPIAIGR